MKPIIIHTEAIAELDGAIAYYDKQKVGLGLDLLVEVEQAIGSIQQNPNLGAVHNVKKVTGVRRYVLQRFPFLIFYAELETLIWIVAIAHGKRKPNYWMQRQLE